MHHFKVLVLQQFEHFSACRQRQALICINDVCNLENFRFVLSFFKNIFKIKIIPEILAESRRLAGGQAGLTWLIYNWNQRSGQRAKEGLSTVWALWGEEWHTGSMENRRKMLSFISTRQDFCESWPYESWRGVKDCWVGQRWDEL